MSIGIITLLAILLVLLIVEIINLYTSDHKIWGTVLLMALIFAAALVTYLWLTSPM